MPLACAGIDPCRPPRRCKRRWFPRLCGDRPETVMPSSLIRMVPPPPPPVSPRSSAQFPPLIEPREPAPALLLLLRLRLGLRPRPTLQPTHPQRLPPFRERHRRVHEQPPCAAGALLQRPPAPPCRFPIPCSSASSCLAPAAPSTPAAPGPEKPPGSVRFSFPRRHRSVNAARFKKVQFQDGAIELL